MEEQTEYKVQDKRFTAQSPDREFHAPVAPSGDSFIETVERLSRNPDIGFEKIDQVIKWQERVMDRMEEQEFNAAMTRAQNRIELVIADTKNDQTGSNYAKLKSILVKAKPHYTEEGFSLMFYEGPTDKPNHKRVMVDIMHRAGHTKTRYADVAIQTTGIKGSAMMTEIHGEGSAFSYGRRYLTCMIFNIPTGDDDDGQAAGRPPDYINEDQVTEINDLLKETGSNIKIFLKVAKAESVDKILQSNYSWLIAKLKKKQSEMRQPGE